MDFIFLPADAARILRSALLFELGRPATQIEEASMTPGRERHPELFIPALNELDTYRAAIEEIGWSEPPHRRKHKRERSCTAMIDLDRHREVILTALHTQLEVERDLMSEQGKRRDVRRQRKTAKRNAKAIEKLLRTNGLPVDVSRENRQAGA